MVCYLVLIAIVKALIKTNLNVWLKQQVEETRKKSKN